MAEVPKATLGGVCGVRPLRGMAEIRTSRGPSGRLPASGWGMHENLAPRSCLRLGQADNGAMRLFTATGALLLTLSAAPARRRVRRAASRPERRVAARS
jgi:hypothetical protein